MIAPDHHGMTRPTRVGRPGQRRPRRTGRGPLDHRRPTPGQIDPEHDGCPDPVGRGVAESEQTGPQRGPSPLAQSAATTDRTRSSPAKPSDASAAVTAVARPPSTALTDVHPPSTSTTTARAARLRPVIDEQRLRTTHPPTLTGRQRQSGKSPGPANSALSADPDVRAREHRNDGGVIG